MFIRVKNSLKIAKLLCYSFVFLSSVTLFAQSKNVAVAINVVDVRSKAVSDVTISLISPTASFYGQTDENGFLLLKVPASDYLISYIHLSYQTIEKPISVRASMRITQELEWVSNSLEEVIITAQEGKGLFSKSVINREAMEHLQPSSFADIMELVPGGLSKAPNLNGVNRALIREFGHGGKDYTTSSLGVQFVMDGNVMNSNADLQQSVLGSQMIGNNGKLAAGKETSSIGVDMRTIPTNDIARIEIIRGIPGVSYGDLTSGLILIERKSGSTALQGRIKADGFSKSYYLGKGISLSPTWDLNTSLDYLSAKADPRNTYEEYNRFATSLRSTKTFKWNNDVLIWKSFLDFNINIDKNKVDPDSGYEKVDSYKNEKKLVAFSNNLEYLFRRSSFLKKIKFTSSVRQGFDAIKQRIFVQYSGPIAVSIAKEQGINEGYFPDLSFIAAAHTEGRPLDINSKLESTAEFTALTAKHNLEFGLDYKYAKNKGRGQMYDVLKPPSTALTSRPRSYKDIPGYQNVALFIGDRLHWNIQENQLSFYAGIRTSKMLGMDKTYALSDKVYVEPRFITQWSLPRFNVNGTAIGIDFTFGYGELYKQPTQYMLYPNLRYKDYQQLNFRPENTALHYVNFMTYVEDLTNRELVAARNIKKEVRLDLSFGKHEFFMTYFHERMPSGFRRASNYKVLTYNRYDASGLDIETMTDKPNIDELPYENRKVFQDLIFDTNGSSTTKQGIEFGYTSPRIKSLSTKFTLSGAYFKNVYVNNDPVQEMSNKSINGQSFPYVGIYQSDHGFVYSGMNYNLIVDTYLPTLGMNLSGSFQGVLFRDETRQHRKDTPEYYFSYDQELYAFTEADKEDMYKQWLVRNVSLTDNFSSHFNFDIRINLKVTKKIFDAFKLSLFVNKLFTYYTPYTFNGVKVERKEVSEPYFGMELTYKF